MKRWSINKNLPKIFEKQKQDKLSQFSFKEPDFFQGILQRTYSKNSETSEEDMTGSILFSESLELD